MAQIDFTVADLEQFKLPYEEGMAITEELSKKVERIYHHFHKRFLLLENEARADEHLSYALFSFDTALEAFSIVAKNMVRSGKTSSGDITGVYYEYGRL
ncbi:hypothetical protein LEGA110927_09100 [Leuconostoc gasicomitatum]|uniref:hypothetical protein n=1 Tax=Leuconostoc gasicomitatum TaxID=115778 RepID=UPI000BD496A0|nr:hypothetical protein [Leuconostoc gasicomitatum]MBZ5944533.1 hypothetical protein [Leuconostoc gasicomitatum]MBZ5967842.1 hypothetical protein [Leuconostoc gasicomitatum]MBZ5972054.1 hypothetical protein [Leuconostoc gasicomitatum]MBZ5972471.1 hypothetical protein [Leuconostoc gasicomitatum]QFS14863.1 hypothetical protein BHS03_04050 [Leuconostoc gasicomitatum]